VQFTTSGIYLIIESPGYGLVAKLAVESAVLPGLASTGEFIEVHSFLGSVYVKFGTCK
jgi:hypothetical protein